MTGAAALCEPTPIQIDPRPCGLCGRTVDQHERVDHGEGPLTGRVILGWAMIAMFFLALAAFAVVTVGLAAAIVVFCITACIAGWIGLAVYLARGDE